MTSGLQDIQEIVLFVLEQPGITWVYIGISGQCNISGQQRHSLHEQIQAGRQVTSSQRLGEGHRHRGCGTNQCAALLRNVHVPRLAAANDSNWS
jgi:hypothetical protein